MLREVRTTSSTDSIAMFAISIDFQEGKISFRSPSSRFQNKASTLPLDATGFFLSPALPETSTVEVRSSLQQAHETAACGEFAVSCGQKSHDQGEEASEEMSRGPSLIMELAMAAEDTRPRLVGQA